MTHLTRPCVFCARELTYEERDEVFDMFDDVGHCSMCLKCAVRNDLACPHRKFRRECLEDACVVGLVMTS